MTQSGHDNTQTVLNTTQSTLNFTQNRQDTPQSTAAVSDEEAHLRKLFDEYNRKYFDSQLGRVEVRWSRRMTQCAGTCTYKRDGRIIIGMSEPILKYRTEKDITETLLHEMIHALLFATYRMDDHDGHGPLFLKEAKRVSALAGVRITVYHNFHDEVDHYLTHIWQCTGICSTLPPYYGLVKRSVNRPPQPADRWYHQHQMTCGGTYIKIGSPDNKDKKNKKKKESLDNYLIPNKRPSTSQEDTSNKRQK
ncbi:SprT-like family-domain-containing protein [Pilobolus umbonatus]|nr:SprT-like family-domain-containing protein [Pilobolus umbonatus]